MELQTISKVSKYFGISTRTLRYYEQVGLITPIKRDDSAYRAYDEHNLIRLRQIIILRKLRIPLKKIAEILQRGDAAVAIEAFEHNLAEIEDEITALSTIRNVIKSFIERLNLGSAVFALPDDESLLEVVDALTVSKINFKEERSMDELNKASEKLNKLTDRDVRIIYLPPSTVAASHYIGDEPEHHAGIAMEKFVRESDLINIKPDVRCYGFNHPNPGCLEGGGHGYEFWVTIPDNMDVPEPLVKKHFEGGLYGAHMIPIGAFEEWGWLWDWAQNNDKYDANLKDDGGQCMFGLLEEHLNYRNLYLNYRNLSDFAKDKYTLQLDLLVPIKTK